MGAATDALRHARAECESRLETAQSEVARAKETLARVISQAEAEEMSVSQIDAAIKIVSEIEGVTADELALPMTQQART